MNNPFEDGGTAFPAGPGGDTMHGEDGRVWHQYQATSGMSLRDWFAGQANENDVSQYRFSNGVLNGLSREQAKYAYADAMIAARKGSQ